MNEPIADTTFYPGVKILSAFIDVLIGSLFSRHNMVLGKITLKH